MKRLNIAVDFDGTVVEHDYPRIGSDVDHAVAVLKRLVDAGHRLILWTLRDGRELAEAQWWFSEHGIPLYGVNNSPDRWSESPKANAQLFIDDAALGCPLVASKDGRSVVDWRGVASMLLSRGVLAPAEPA